MADMKLHVVFTSGRGILGNLVRFWTRSEYAHVVLAFTDDSEQDAMEPWVAEASPDTGTTYRPNTHLLDWGLDSVAFAVDAQQAQAVAAFAHSERGHRYDYWGAVASALPWLGAREHIDRWFCSEFATAALQLIGKLPKTLQPWRITPQDLYLMIEGDA